jgi:DNA-binding PadR family transcriptional regulator
MTAPSVGSLELAALLSVARLGSDAYGLLVRRDLAERTGRDYSVGAVYTTLQRLEDKGLLTSHAGEPLPVRGGRSRRPGTLTGAGARARREAERHATSIWAGVGSLGRPEPA